jgi:FKBP-type peptidyl-prolyl cis-trans isomerase
MCCVLLPTMAFAEDAAPAATDTITPELEQKFSYAIGRDLAGNLQPIHEVLNLDAFKQGLDDASAGKPGAYTQAELDDAKTQMGRLVRAKAQAEQAAKSEANLKAAQAFLDKNRKRKGVITTASGLQYEVLKSAKGEHPKADSTVTVHYRGMLADGTEFDNSYTRGTPVTFPLPKVIPAWTEGVQLMVPGAKYKFYVPPALGYGERGIANHVGPNELLIFEVELVSFGETPPG